MLLILAPLLALGIRARAQSCSYDSRSFTYEKSDFPINYQYFDNCAIPGSDFDSYDRQNAPDFTNCMNQCIERGPLCYGLSFDVTGYLGFQNCYLKNAELSGFSAVQESFQVQSAIIVGIGQDDDCSGLSSPHQSSSGNSYYTFCGYDISDGNLDRRGATSLEDCIDQCDSASGCVAVVYEASQLHGFLNCYLKSSDHSSPESASFAVDAATRAGSGSSPVTTSDSSPSTYDSSTTTTSPTTSSDEPETTSINDNTSPVSYGHTVTEITGTVYISVSTVGAAAASATDAAINSAVNLSTYKVLGRLDITAIIVTIGTIFLIRIVA